MLWYSAAMTKLANSLGYPVVDTVTYHHSANWQGQLGLQPLAWMSMTRNRLGYMSTPVTLLAALCLFKSVITPLSRHVGDKPQCPISNSWEGTLMLRERVQMVTCATLLKICWALCRIVSTCGPHHALHIGCVNMPYHGAPIWGIL